MIEITATTKQLAVIGDPVEHSFSPQIHNFISEELGMNYAYSAWHVKGEDIPAAIAGVRALGVSGINVTVPHKKAVMPYLDEISPEALEYDSVNTILNKNGRLIGYSTDAEGFYLSLKHEGFELEGKDIIILGAGGVVRPLAMMFASKKARSVTIINRTREKAEKIAAEIKGKTGADIGCEIKLKHYDLAVNMTSVGLYPNVDACPEFDFGLIDEKSFVADLIYNPEETLFLKKAKAQGAKTINGLGMLIFQGIIAYELFTGKKVPEGLYERIVKEVFKR